MIISNSIGVKRPRRSLVIRLVCALLVEMNDEMIAADRRYIAEASLAALLEPDREVSPLPAAPRT